ncbi:MAG: LysR family transcriptional regulator [Acidobacteria bacterium]|nr:LysR family transcriptional regulator [Acidobacteriota bacterium]
MPTLRQLEYLVAVSETRHFGRAAERVHVTQPTLSEQLRALEQRLGVQLVERSRSAVVVTPIGTEVVEISRRMLRDAQRIRDCTGNIGQGLAGVVRIGLPSTIGPYLLPSVVPNLHARYPELKLHVREDLPHALRAASPKACTTSSWRLHKSPIMASARQRCSMSRSIWLCLSTTNLRARRTLLHTTCPASTFWRWGQVINCTIWWSILRRRSGPICASITRARASTRCAR